MYYKDKTKVEIEYHIRKLNEKLKTIKNNRVRGRINMYELGKVLKEIIDAYEYYNKTYKQYNMKNKVVLAMLKFEYGVIAKREGLK